jgi:hypothetical protein
MRRRGPLSLDLSDRDRAVLVAVSDHTLLTSGQIERLLFTDRHASAVATRRRCQAVLRRLVDLELLDRLHRRQGGHRAGSAGFTYRLTTRGHRALSHGNRGTRESPTERQVLHLLACAEVSIQVAEAQRAGRLSSVTVTHEPETWRRFTGLHAGLEVLKPDLQLDLTTTDGWELRWFVEVDLATEHLPTVLKKSAQYQRYWQTGTEPHPVFPRVLWSVPDDTRAAAIETAIGRTSSLTNDLFQVATAERTLTALLGTPLNEINNTKGGEP